MCILSDQGVVPRSGVTENHLRATILKEHLEQDRPTISEHGLDPIRVLANLSRFLHGGGDISGGTVVGCGIDTKNIFNRTDGLDKVLLDC